MKSDEVKNIDRGNKTRISDDKKALEQYKKMKAQLNGYRKNEEDSEEPDYPAYQRFVTATGLIEQASKVLQQEDDEVYRIVELRYLKGNNYKTTVLYFSGLGYSDKTIMRRLNKGIQSIAETIKTWDKLDAISTSST